jgi:hypothetical protein
MSEAQSVVIVTEAPVSLPASLRAGVGSADDLFKIVL